MKSFRDKRLEHGVFTKSDREGGAKSFRDKRLEHGVITKSGRGGVRRVSETRGWSMEFL